MNSIKENVAIIVAADTAKQRLDVFLARQLPQFSRSRLQQLIRERFVSLNGEPARPREVVHAGDAIEVREPPPQKLENEPEAIALSILYEDSDLIVLNKPPGLVVHPGAGHRGGTLVNALLHHCPALSGIGGAERPGIVHRLDKETSGCIVVAKNDQTHRALSTQFAGRSVTKVYLALVAGKLHRRTGTIEAAIGRHGKDRQRMAISERGRSARTDYRVVRANDQASLVECVLHSGRTHQIRVHLHHLGHPILGDKIYGARHAKGFPRQMLHAWKLEFAHPATNARLRFEAPIPEDLQGGIGSVGLQI